VSFKDDVKFVKDELSSDEKVLEGAFKLEKIYKKHKTKIWTSLIVVVLAFGGNAINNYIIQSNLESANSSLLTLQNNANDNQALANLKSKNPKLYELFLYSNAVKSKNIKVLNELSNSKNSIISDISKYHNSIISNKIGDSKYYKDLSLIEDAYKFIESNDNKKALNKISLIEQNSPLYSLGIILKHQTIEVLK